MKVRNELINVSHRKTNKKHLLQIKKWTEFPSQFNIVDKHFHFKNLICSVDNEHVLEYICLTSYEEVAEFYIIDIEKDIRGKDLGSLMVKHQEKTLKPKVLK